MRDRVLDPSTGEFVIPGNYRDVIYPIERIANELGKPLGRTLDIGCNSTWMATFIEDYYGVDTNGILLDWARKHWVSKGRWTLPEAESRIQTVDPLSPRTSFEAGSFDTVILRDVLEHVEKPLEVFGEAARVLALSGLLYVSAPDSQKHVWDEPTHKRPYPVAAQKYLGHMFGLELAYSGFESVAPGTQRVARLAGGRSPVFVRIGARLSFWPRNAVTIHRRTSSLVPLSS
jgi:SAM-dependent methyltransferase